MYLNDLENNLDKNREGGVSTEDIVVFMKIGPLLYADDTLLIADNKRDLQVILDSFNDYCKTWKLKINDSKSKLVIFGARNTKRHI